MGIRWTNTVQALSKHCQLSKGKAPERKIVENFDWKNRPLELRMTKVLMFSISTCNRIQQCLNQNRHSIRFPNTCSDITYAKSIKLVVWSNERPKRISFIFFGNILLKMFNLTYTIHFPS